MSIRLISWNVNGLRAAVGKGFEESIQQLSPDILCLQEIKLSEGQIMLSLPDLDFEAWNYAEKKGYSGTAVYSKGEPLSIALGVGDPAHDQEGRVITVEYPDFYLVNCYTPNSQRGLTRLEYRMVWEDHFLEFLKALDDKKPVVLCGDLNVAHEEIDIKNPSTNHKNAGFTDEERGKMSRLLENGFVDTFRYLHPDETDAYTWWSYFSNARARNIGWRIDYFIISQRLVNKLQSASIHPNVLGSDHCPISIELQL